MDEYCLMLDIFFSCRCLAACATVFRDRSNVHHAILEALNSNDEVEVMAAVHAISEFAKVSQKFNAGAIDTIAAKIQVLELVYLIFHSYERNYHTKYHD